MKEWIVKTLLKCKWFKAEVVCQLGINMLYDRIIELESKIRKFENELCSTNEPKEQECVKKKRKYNKRKQ